MFKLTFNINIFLLFLLLFFVCLFIFLWKRWNEERLNDLHKVMPGSCYRVRNWVQLFTSYVSEWKTFFFGYEIFFWSSLWCHFSNSRKLCDGHWTEWFTFIVLAHCLYGNDLNSSSPFPVVSCTWSVPSCAMKLHV